ncbi:MAG: GspE/PulE family protein [Chloroflexi bacterium]|nr:GspE/PulE family protein [Chloroflexota bacterium]
MTADQLLEAEQLMMKEGKRLTSVLQEKGWTSKDTLTTVLSFHLKVPVADPRQVEVDPEAVRLVPEALATEANVLPIATDRDGTLRVLMEDPGDFDTINKLATLTGRQIKAVLPIGDGLDELIKRNYSAGADLTGAIDMATRLGAGGTAIEQVPREVAQDQDTFGDGGTDAGSSLTSRNLSQAPVAHAVDMITLQAVKIEASDGHFRPGQDSSKVLYRVDGVLHEGPVVPLTLHEGMVSRVKVMANMDITETRRPQDGHFTMTFGERNVDFRVSTTPTTWGELMVIRALYRDEGLRPLNELGMEGATLISFRRALKSPYGMVLVSGPTGAGKTTTLYGGITELIDGRSNIITIEEPIEYRLDNINQVEVNRAAGIDFAHGLRSILRLDPDIILVGEIRDTETASMAVDSALTGHLVLSAIHANNAAGAAVRLVDLGVEPFLVGSSLVGVEAQRLARRVCDHCKLEREPTAMEAIAYEQIMQEEASEFFIGEGCNLCGHTGYQGRIGIFEFMQVSEEIRRLIAGKSTADEIRAQAIREGMIPLEKAGMMMVKEGITTISEVMRATFVV